MSSIYKVRLIHIIGFCDILVGQESTFIAFLGVFNFHEIFNFRSNQTESNPIADLEKREMVFDLDFDEKHETTAKHHENQENHTKL